MNSYRSYSCGFGHRCYRFEIGEVEQILTDLEDEAADPADDIESAWRDSPVVSKTGDLWRMAGHRLLCGDARSEADLSSLMGEDSAAMAFLDPPYNVRVTDIVGRGEVQHPEFAMASGEMAKGEFIAFLRETLLRAERVSRPGAVHFVCMDWRHIVELLTAGEAVYGAMLNLIVWAKTNGGQGSFYRSQHELIGVFRVGEDPHLNAVQLGRHGRNRSNVWTYAGVNTFRAGRLEEMRSHPTAKPVAMIADAIKDCTRRGEIVLDTFAGSGSTLMAAERVGRKARCLEIAPNYVDVAIRRWQAFTGKDAIHDATGQSFDELAAERNGRAEAGSSAASSAARKTGRAA